MKEALCVTPEEAGALLALLAAAEAVYEVGEAAAVATVGGVTTGVADAEDDGGAADGDTGRHCEYHGLE